MWISEKIIIFPKISLKENIFFKFSKKQFVWEIFAYTI